MSLMTTACTLADETEDDVAVSSERERAASLVLACRHLPSQLLAAPGQRAGMLAEAAKTYQKLGDRKALQDCHNMMAQEGKAQYTAPISVH